MRYLNIEHCAGKEEIQPNENNRKKLLPNTFSLFGATTEPMFWQTSLLCVVYASFMIPQQAPLTVNPPLTSSTVYVMDELALR